MRNQRLVLPDLTLAAFPRREDTTAEGSGTGATWPQDLIAVEHGECLISQDDRTAPSIDGPYFVCLPPALDRTVESGQPLVEKLRLSTLGPIVPGSFSVEVDLPVRTRDVAPSTLRLRVGRVVRIGAASSMAAGGL